jgi:hypothetical protein
LKVCGFSLVLLDLDVLGLFCFCILQDLSVKWVFFAQFIRCFAICFLDFGFDLFAG